MAQRIVSYYARPASFSTGGVNTSRQQWMRAFAQHGYKVEVISAHGGFDTQLVEHDRIIFRALPHTGKSRMSMLPIGLGRLLRNDDLVYLHEGWTPSNVVAAALCRLKKIDYVVIPHGVYASSIVSSLKFRRVRRTIESWVLSGARAVHLFFDSEIPELAAVSPTARPVVAVTGLDLPAERWLPSTELRYLAWVGRYDIAHKGIDVLLRALASIPDTERPRIEMRGPDHRGDKVRVQALVTALGLDDVVTVGDNLAPNDVLSFLRDSQGFVHVPRWEAFGRTIVEALSLGVPVVLSRQAHIAGALEEAHAARIVDGLDTAGIAEALLALWSGEVSTGDIGRQWIEEHLSWPATSARLLEALDKPVSLGGVSDA